MATEKLTGPQKAAMFLLSLGEELSSQIIKQFSEEEIKKLGSHISQINYIGPKTVEGIFAEFSEMIQTDQPLLLGPEKANQFLKNVVAKAVPADKARDLMEEIEEEGNWNLFQKIKKYDAKTIANFVRNEHPQTIAIILSHLESGQAAGILSELSIHLQTEVVYRMAELENVSPEIVEEIDQVLQEEVAAVKSFKGQSVGGIRPVAEILNQMDSAVEGNILKGIEEYRQGLADEIRQLMFVFEDLVEVDDRGIMAILKEVNNEELLLALKTSSDELKEKIFKNMSERAAQMMKEDLEVMGPVRLRDVETAQQSIIKVAKKLEGEGKIVLAGKGKDEAFV
ncbi:MAG: flagellar motor switch protein FliG [Deltaproteobacteria bacterium]|nr:flagellar motor switch protein FliG [Deltaproteobacteria bacterium]